MFYFASARARQRASRLAVGLVVSTALLSACSDDQSPTTTAAAVPAPGQSAPVDAPAAFAVSGSVNGLVGKGWYCRTMQATTWR